VKRNIIQLFLGLVLLSNAVHTASHFTFFHKAVAISFETNVAHTLINLAIGAAVYGFFSYERSIDSYMMPLTGSIETADTRFTEICAHYSIPLDASCHLPPLCESAQQELHSELAAFIAICNSLLERWPQFEWLLVLHPNKSNYQHEKEKLIILLRKARTLYHSLGAVQKIYP
jgi:hypothetical protein